MKKQKEGNEKEDRYNIWSMDGGIYNFQGVALVFQVIKKVLEPVGFCPLKSLKQYKTSTAAMQH